MKKIRGYQRKVRLVAGLCTNPDPLAVDHLQRYHYDYAKLGLGPFHWHRWHGRQPPRVVRQQAAGHLLRTLLSWQAPLTALGEPFYLAVWLVEAEFAHVSQVVAAIRERINWYEQSFGPPVPEGPPLPAEYRALPGAERLTWTTHLQHEWLDADDFPRGWPAHLLRRDHALHTTDDGQHYLLRPLGWVWVGRAAATSISTGRM